MTYWGKCHYIHLSLQKCDEIFKLRKTNKKKNSLKSTFQFSLPFALPYYVQVPNEGEVGVPDPIANSIKLDETPGRVHN